MVLRPFFSYFGSKWRIATKYPAPRHDTIIEPFAGSAGYALRYPDRDVLLVDSYEPIVRTWRYLIDASEDEILALPDIEDDQSVDDLDAPDDARLLIGWWLNGGVSSPRKVMSAWYKKHRDTNPNQCTYWGRPVRERIARQLPAIQHWTVVQASYHELDDVEATWFVDPPYQQAGKDYVKSSRDIDYDHLGSWCRRRPGQVIVCENEGADWLPFRSFMVAKAMAGKHRTGKSREVIWTAAS